MKALLKQSSQRWAGPGVLCQLGGSSLNHCDGFPLELALSPARLHTALMQCCYSLGGEKGKLTRRRMSSSDSEFQAPSITLHCILGSSLSISEAGATYTHRPCSGEQMELGGGGVKEERKPRSLSQDDLSQPPLGSREAVS
ncbi:hypothetical protein DPEC_G00346670 [Dallia pectoralis]|uniref:Uncharacterized protein n=1 Tax=Dallia pectoralis TaxID=75939 RepID=A0ACC2F3V0_DALPE|nr:hypothetical protein DPEC_G00346670 [Dallia pectoralis]